MNFDWFTFAWLMENLHWFIFLLVIGIIILFFFPVLLGYDLKEKNNSTKDKEKNK